MGDVTVPKLEKDAGDGGERRGGQLLETRGRVGENRKPLLGIADYENLPRSNKNLLKKMYRPNRIYGTKVGMKKDWWSGALFSMIDPDSFLVELLEL